MKLEDEFVDRVYAAIDECYSLGYPPRQFQSMIETRHPIEVAKSFVLSGEFQSGFKKLKSMNRSDLTIESLMTEAKFESLFSKEELEAARWRLKNG